MVKFRLFLLLLIVTAIALCTILYVNHRQRPTSPDLVGIVEDVYYAPQLTAKDVFSLARHHIRTIVDLRPDGEAFDQASSADMEHACRTAGLSFHYVPVPHESIPDAAVNALSEAIAHEPKPVVLYCRTGRRAVRTFALAQASKANGPDAEAILTMVQSAGFNADDLKDNINRRVAHRVVTPTVVSE